MDIFGITIGPFKDDPVLVIDPNRVFALVIAFERF